jgi:hypothetical protein
MESVSIHQMFPFYRPQIILSKLFFLRETFDSLMAVSEISAEGCAPLQMDL